VQAETIHLTWQTVWEWDNNHFEVQHSIDGNDFTTLAEIKGQGTTVFISNYQYRHLDPLSGIQYYRLRQVDFDGTFAYSDVVAINFDKNTTLNFSFWPNPARGQIEVSLPGIPQQPLEVSLTNGLGQVQALNFEALGNKLQVDLPTQLPAGLYWLQVFDRQEKATKPVVIQ